VCSPCRLKRTRRNHLSAPVRGVSKKDPSDPLTRARKDPFWDAPGIDGAQANASDVNPLSYRVILEPDADDGGFNVVVPAFPTARTQGDDVEDAMRNAREVIELELGYLAKRGLPIPPSDVENVRIERVSVAPPAA